MIRQIVLISYMHLLKILQYQYLPNKNHILNYSVANYNYWENAKDNTCNVIKKRIFWKHYKWYCHICRFDELIVWFCYYRCIEGACDLILKMSWWHVCVDFFYSPQRIPTTIPKIEVIKVASSHQQWKKERTQNQNVHCLSSIR